MAPVKATAVGVTPQCIDDPELSSLLESLKGVEVLRNESYDSDEVDRLVAILRLHPEWKFEEQVDLHAWIPVLNSIDSALSYLLHQFPQLLLVEPAPRKDSKSETKESDVVRHAESLEDTEKVPLAVVEGVCHLLRFLASLLKNSINKVVFNSAEELVDLLAAFNDDIARYALRALAAVACPPALHKQQAPDGHQHTSALSNSSAASQRRLVSLAKGWGSRGSGLGLFVCATSDDSEQGQGTLPVEAGEINFQFFLTEKADNGKTNNLDEAKSENMPNPQNQKEAIHLRTIRLSVEDIAQNPSHMMDTSGDEKPVKTKKQKRARLANDTARSYALATKSTAEIFFWCLGDAGGRARIPEDRLFPLLADIRLARAFHSSASRTLAIENRLTALIAVLYGHPSQEIVSGYFQAQPELCVELIDLLRPTVSSSTISSSASVSSVDGNSTSGWLQPIAGLADPQEIPYSLRFLALETLTALVARRDGASGGLTGVARQSNVLNELGVGKGLYLGVLPALVRYSLASLAAFLTGEGAPSSVGGEKTPKGTDEQSLSIEVGLAFIEATRRPQLQEGEYVLRALQFVDAVLTLTSAVVSAPSGTAALTDCGLIPALLGVVSVEPTVLSSELLGKFQNKPSADQANPIQAHLRFIISQAIQIMEAAIVTHSTALSAFRDLGGVNVLTSRLHSEIEEIKQQSPQLVEEDGPVPMETDDADPKTQDIEESTPRVLVSSRRVLLFSIVNCMTVVFHQESTSSSASTPSGGAQLRKPELTSALTEIIEEISSYGGVLAALTCSLLSDVMNSDPHVVHHVHNSGLAKTFFRVLSMDEVDPVWGPQPLLPPVAELIMALPNVISALSLTADGASKVAEANPFPSLLRVLYHPKYAMPRSRCLLNEMTAIVGTGLDEIMRHVPNLRPQVMSAIVGAMKEVVSIGKSLLRREKDHAAETSPESPASTLENERSCLMQYVLDFGQMLEQILHVEDHCEPFVQVGGLDTILQLFPLLLPPSLQFLASTSCLSCPSVSTLAHSTTEDSLTVAFKSIALNYDSQKMLKLLREHLADSLSTLQGAQRAMRNLTKPAELDGREGLNAFGVLEHFPPSYLHELKRKDGFAETVERMSEYLRTVVALQWQTSLLAVVIKTASQRSQEGGTGWGRSEREWKKELSSEPFETLITQLSEFHQSAVLESCRLRSSDNFESSYRARLGTGGEKNAVRYRLRIVCQEGAVVRDGIEIDSCTNVGSLEMGQIVDAYDRCVNSSGVLRYRTRRGWISEHTRGHGRESIAEVIDVSDFLGPPFKHDSDPKKRVEFSVATIPSVGGSVFARLQTSYRDLMASISRVVVQGLRSVPVRAMSFQQGTVGGHVRTLLEVMRSSFLCAFNQEEVVEAFVSPDTSKVSRGGLAMYVGTVLAQLNSCLFEDKRERSAVNVALLLALMGTDDQVQKAVDPDENDVSRNNPGSSIGLLAAADIVLSHTLEDVAERVSDPRGKVDPKRPIQSLGRTVAASLPTTIFLLRRLVSVAPIKSSPLMSILNRLSRSDLTQLIGCSTENPFVDFVCGHTDGEDATFSSEVFARVLHLCVSRLFLGVWKDPRFGSLPPHAVHPLTSIVSDVISGLEDALKPPSKNKSSDSREEGFPGWPGGLLAATARNAARGEANARDAAEEEFEPSEEAISRLMEMGFSRDHAMDAIESTESNRVEVAMEYALSHQPASPESMQRRRSRREERRRRRQEARALAANNQGQDQDTAAQEGDENADEPSGDAQEPTGDAAQGAHVEGGEEAKRNDPMETDEDAEDRAESPQEKWDKKQSLLSSRLQKCLDGWIDSAPAVATDVLAAGSSSQHVTGARGTNSEIGNGNGDAEALTAILCSFLVSFCQRYPAKRDGIVFGLLSQLRSTLEEGQDEKEAWCRVIPGKEGSCAVLCHSAVLLVRALPRLRTHVLRLGIVHCFVTCINQCSISVAKDTQFSGWPIWLAPALLLVDVMAQPIAIFPEKTIPEGQIFSFPEGASIGKDELDQVREEHEKQSEAMSTMAETLFRSLSEGNKKTPKESSAPDNTDSGDNKKSEPTNGIDDCTDKKQEARSPFDSVPSFCPLLPAHLTETAVHMSLRILGIDGRFGEESKHIAPPGIVHGALLLLARLLRSTKLSSLCVRLGAAELILSLPRKCRFVGCTGLVTCVLRRLLEDEQNLQGSMETEIRSIVARLHKRQNRHATDEKPVVSRQLFLRSITPLLCRDPQIFLRAVMTTVSFDGDSSKDKGKVTLLSGEQRARNVKKISTLLQGKPAALPTSESNKRGRSSLSGRSPKSKSLHRNSLTRRGSFSKKGRRESTAGKRERPLDGSSPNHIMSLLIQKMMDLCTAHPSPNSTFGEDTSFLWVADVLEIMADLVLAVPACAAAIHRFRAPSAKETQNTTHPLHSLRHGLSGCSPPPRTVVGFLLHVLLPQDRWNYRNDHDTWDRHNQPDKKKNTKDIYLKTRVAQTTARLLVSLVARTGEGRRRVLADLAFALCGGSIEGNSPQPPPPASSDGLDGFEHCALQAWGDLCIGLAAPRSNGINHENNSSLSFEVVKLMMEFRMPLALVWGIMRAKLKHPLAPGTCSSLLVPLEVFTRPSVTDELLSMLEREALAKEKAAKQEQSPVDKNCKKKKQGLVTRNVSIGPSQRAEAAFADDAMIEDVFAPSRNPLSPTFAFQDADDEMDDAEGDDDIADEEIDDADDQDDIESDSDDNLSESESEGSNEDGDDSGSEDESDGEGDDESSEQSDNSDGVGDSIGESEGEDAEDEPVDEWNEEADGGFFYGDMDDEEMENGGTQRGTDNDFEDWDRIEAPGFGGMVLGSRRHGRGPNLAAHARGFVETAEAMIGTLLRTGEIPGDALAGLEGSLGFRIIHSNRNPLDFGGEDRRNHPGHQSNNRGENNSSRRDGDMIGALPYVNQRNPPDVGYSIPGGGGRWNDISAMEYVYGGPAMAAASRNYDVVTPVSEEEEDADSYPMPSVFDSRLFPGGPAASTHTRPSQTVHPLLSGVELPPINALVSDLPSNGERSARRAQPNQRRPGELSSWSLTPENGVLVTTSTGNIVRLNRPNPELGDNMFSRASDGGASAGWTADGQPLEPTADFSGAFDRALAEVMSAYQQTSEASNSNEGSANGEGESEPSAMDVSNENNQPSEDATTTDAQREANPSRTSADNADGVEAPGSASEATVPEANNSSASDGEGVASSLAASLRLSPHHDADDPEAEPSRAATDTEMNSLNASENSSDGPGSENRASTDDGAEEQVAETREAEEEPGETVEQMETDGRSPGRSNVSPVGDQGQQDQEVERSGAENPSNHAADEGPEDGATNSTTQGADNQGDTGDEQEQQGPESDGNPGTGNEPNENGLVCPPGMDLEVFNSLPFEVQRDVVEQHQAEADLAAQLDSSSGYDPETLAALPGEIRREIIAQDQRERRMREQAPADPSNAEEMDNASFVASLAPDLRREILVTADEAFLGSLPPDIRAEAQILRERAALQRRGDPMAMQHNEPDHAENNGGRQQDGGNDNAAGSGSRKKSRTGKIKVDQDRSCVVCVPQSGQANQHEPFGSDEVKTLVRLLFLLSPVRPQRLLQRVFQNLTSNPTLRCVISRAFTRLLNDDGRGAAAAIDSLRGPTKDGGPALVSNSDDFPPHSLIGADPEVLDNAIGNPLLRRRQGNSSLASMAASLPMTAKGSHESHTPPVVSTRVIDTLTYLGKNSPRFCIDILSNETMSSGTPEGSCFEQVLDLLSLPRFSRSSTNLDQLLAMLEVLISPMSVLPKEGEEVSEVPQKELEAASATGKEWVEVPRVIVSPSRLKLLCSTLKMESCRDSAFSKVNLVARRLCRIEANRGHILSELASVAQALGGDAIRDLRLLNIRLNDAVTAKQAQAVPSEPGAEGLVGAHPSSAVTLSTSSSELKLLRVLQTLQSLCSVHVGDEQGSKKHETLVTDELVSILQGINLDELWIQLSSCLKAVKVLEGISSLDELEEKSTENDDRDLSEAPGDADVGDNGSSVDNETPGGKKLQNSAAGLLTRFLPVIEAFFVANASATRSETGILLQEDDETKNEASSQQESENAGFKDISCLVGGKKVLTFVADNRVLLNALVRNNSGLLEKGLKALVQVTRCRTFLDFDVKRQWFKTQIRRLRQQASRRHGSLRLNIRRKHVFEDAYHQLRLRNADEMRSRLHITFRNEEGVDAGGLSREFFGILAKEMFNPNYALFTSTEDGCTFQPNQHSNINPDHLSYFRFVGRIVGKAVADGFLLDAHFTRSLYKHMLGIKPTHHDMEAIDPDYYKNLKAILEYSLGDIGLDLTFSIEDHSFGRSQIIDLIPNGRTIAVTDETKARYVSLICQHRMTTAISSQIKAYLDGFYELVSRDLIAIFSPRELELLISGLPDIDMHDLKSNTEYHGWKATDAEIEWFWNVMFKLTRNEKAAFLQFVTGSSKVPLAGFAELQGMRGTQKFSIHKVGASSGALMSAHTCFNSLDLPKYQSEEETQEKLLYAISEGQGSFMFA